MTELATLFEFKRWANAELMETVALHAESLPPDAATAIVRLLNHTHVVDRIFRGHLSGVKHGYAATNTPETPTVAELRAAMADTDTWLVDFARSQGPKDLERTCRFTFTDGDAGEMTVGEMLVHLITHGAYHRGTAGRLLREANISPPRELLTRFLHESQPARRTRAQVALP